MTRDENLQRLRDKLARSQGMEGYADRCKAIEDEIARMEAEGGGL